MDIPKNGTDVSQRNLKTESVTPEKQITWIEIGDLFKKWKKLTGYLVPEAEPKERKDSKKRMRAWFMTLNNPTKDDFERLHKDDYQYCMGQIEVGECGTAHVQALIYYTNPRVCPVKKHPRAKIEIADSVIACINYCSKSTTRILGPWEFGEKPEQGKRSDLIALRDEVLRGTSVDDILIRDPMAYHEFGRTLNRIEEIKMLDMFRTEMTLAIWFVGETETGKSHRAFNKFSPKTHYRFPYDNGWWDNYKQQPIVVFNEFRGDSHVPFATMLELIDKWPMDVRRRHRSPMPFISKLIIITSPLDPEKVFGRIDKDDNFDQFKRRIQVVKLDKKYSGSHAVNINMIDELHKSITGHRFVD